MPRRFDARYFGEHAHIDLHHTRMVIDEVVAVYGGAATAPRSGAEIVAGAELTRGAFADAGRPACSAVKKPRKFADARRVRSSAWYARLPSVPTPARGRRSRRSATAALVQDPFWRFAIQVGGLEIQVERDRGLRGVSRRTPSRAGLQPSRTGAAMSAAMLDRRRPAPDRPRRHGVFPAEPRLDDQLYLVANRCPHRGGPLKFGFINADDRGQLVCPLHHATPSPIWTGADARKPSDHPADRGLSVGGRMRHERLDPTSFWRSVRSDERAAPALKLANLVTLSRGVLIAPIFALLLGLGPNPSRRPGRLSGRLRHRPDRRLAGAAKRPLVGLRRPAGRRGRQRLLAGHPGLSAAGLSGPGAQPPYAIALVVLFPARQPAGLSGGVLAAEAAVADVPFLVGQGRRGAAVLPVAADGLHRLGRLAPLGRRRRRGLQPPGADPLHPARRP